MRVYAVLRRTKTDYCLDSVWWSREAAVPRCDELGPDTRVTGVEVQGDPPWVEHDASLDSPDAPGVRCPFLYYTRGGYSANCGHPDHAEYEYDPDCFDTDEYPASSMPPVPDDCPLRRRSVLVSMKGD